MSKFEERYKTLDNRKLLKIVKEAEKYSPTAVEAAQLELSRREVSDDEIQSVKDEISNSKANRKERQQQVKNVEGKAKAIGTELLETINPIQKEAQTVERKINLIVMALSVVMIYHIYTELGMILLMASDGFSGWDSSTVFYFLPMILLPIGIFLFWKRNKIGWVFLLLFFAYNVLVAIISLFMILKSDNEDDGFLGNLYPQPSPVIYIGMLVVFGGMLWVISRADVREEFFVRE